MDSFGGGSQEQVVGYRYYLGIQAVVAHTLDAVLGLMFGEQYGWTGSRTSSGSISVSNESLFGGESNQGGVSGTVYACFGESTQAINGYLSSVAGGPVSAMRGVASLIFRRFYFGNNPYIRQLKVKARRILTRTRGQEQWYADKAAINTSDMNPAHIVYECLTDPEYGRGLDADLIDDAAFRAAADTLHAEGFGLSVLWGGETALDDFLQQILEIIDAVLYDDYAAGTIVLRLLRDDYDPEEIAELTPDEIISCEEFVRPSWGQTTTELHLTYLDDDNKQRTVYERDAAAAEMQGANIAESVTHVAIRTAELAQTVCARELRQKTGNLASVKLSCTRAAEDLRPGDVFRWVWPEFGIVSMILRVVRVSYGTHAGGAVGLECVEDVFSQGQTLVAAPEGSFWTSPQNEPQDVDLLLLQEAPYWFVIRDLAGGNENVLAMWDSESGAMLILAAQSTYDALSFRVLVDSGAGYADASSGVFSPVSTLAEALALAETSTLTVADEAEISSVIEGDLAFAGEEIMLVTAVDGAELTVARGVLDSVPQEHDAGEPVYFDTRRTLPRREFTDGETVDVKLLPRTGRGYLDEDEATAHELTFAARSLRPYPPGKVRVNGEAWPGRVDTDAFTVTWAHRNRLLQTAYVVTQGEDSITPEDGTTYTLRIYGESGDLLRTETELAGTSYDYADEIADAGRRQLSLAVEIEAVRDGYASRQFQRREVERLYPQWEDNTDSAWVGEGDEEESWQNNQ